MFRRLVSMIGLVAAWGIVVAAAPAQAQVNIDQGKSPSEIFSGDCGTCHKTAKGLANGRNAGALAGFLREHYTSSAQQAASLAAYVLGAGSGPAPTAGLKPGTAGEQKTGEAKPGEAKPGEKTAAHPDQDTKIEAEPAAAEPAPAGPGRKPAAGKREPRAVTASRGSRQVPEFPPPALQVAPVVAPETVPAPVATAPAASEPANPEPSNSEASAPAAPQPALPATAAVPSAVPDSAPAPSAAAPSAEATSSASAAAPAEAPPSDSAPVPRDDIPD